MVIGLLIMIDSTAKENYRVSQETIFPFLEHFGIPYRGIDLAKEEIIDFNVNGILIAQEGLGARIPEKIKQSLYQAVKQGTGLINLDYHLNFWKELYEPLKIEKIEKESKTSLIKIGENHETHPHLLPLSHPPDGSPSLRGRIEEGGTEKKLLQPLEFLRVKTEGEPLLLSAEDISPLLLISSPLKLVQFLISPKLWLPEYLGHCAGLDSILLRTIIWAVKKPFVMKAMPPFVTARIDDANGSANVFGKKRDSANKNFAYVGILNKYGYVPNIGLYIDDITEEDGKIIKEKYDQKLAEFSPHAFSDPKNVNEFPVYMHHNGEEFSVEELRENFARVDKKFSHWKIKQSKTVNVHFGEIGLNALPFLKERGLTYMMNPMRFGKAFIDQEARNWHPKPYGYIRGIGGIIDYMLDDPEFFNVYAGEILGPKDYVAPYADFLYSCTPFWNENPNNDLQKAAERGAEQIKLGLNNGFFGCLVAHEQRIATLSLKEFEEVLKRIDKLTSKYNRIFKGYDYIAEYAKSKYDTKITEANYNPTSKEIKLKLTGKSTLPLKIYLFNDENCEYEFKEIPEFGGEIDVILQI